MSKEQIESPFSADESFLALHLKKRSLLTIAKVSCEEILWNIPMVSRIPLLLYILILSSFLRAFIFSFVSNHIFPLSAITFNKQVYVGKVLTVRMVTVEENDIVKTVIMKVNTHGTIRTDLVTAKAQVRIRYKAAK